jgi:hypothetical protein
VKFTFDWTRQLVEMSGWRYQIASEPPPVVVENVRFLAGFRRDWLFPPTLVAQLQAGAVDGAPLSRACGMLPDWPAPLVRSTILHLLWKQHFQVDLTVRLRPSLVLTRKEAR